MYSPATSLARRTAFTLVELMVSIGIVALLAALVLSSTQRMRTAAQSVGCINNLKQLGTGLMLYAQEHDNRLPQAWYNGSGGFLWYFSAAFTPYLGPQGLTRLKLGMCPAWNGTRQNGIPGDVVWVPNTYDSYTLGYPS